MSFRKRSHRGRGTALAVALCLTAPLLAAALRPASAQILGGRPAPQRQGMSTKKKVALLAGAALVYYLYKKHQAKQAETQRTAVAGRSSQNGTRATAKTPQLYRSKNGGVYYRDAQNRPVWLTAPSRRVEVPVDELQRYAPDYQRYRGPAPAAPQGYRTESFEEFDSSLFATSSGSTNPSGPPGPR